MRTNSLPSKQADDPEYHYQCDSAAVLWAKLKVMGIEDAPKAPRGVASGILKAVPANEVIAETSIAGRGNINIKVSWPHIAQRVRTMVLTMARDRGTVEREIVDWNSSNFNSVETETQGETDSQALDEVQLVQEWKNTNNNNIGQIIDQRDGSSSGPVRTVKVKNGGVALWGDVEHFRWARKGSAA